MLTIEIVAADHTTAATGPTAHPHPDQMARRLLAALTPLHDPGSPLPVIACAALPFTDGTGALVKATCVADSGTQAMDTVAARLETVLLDDPRTREWCLHAGDTVVHSGDS
ncbi:hypothetical protein ACFQXA_08790 [Nocardiopsis composta]